MSFANSLFRELFEQSGNNVASLADKLADDGVRILPIKYVYAIGHLILEIECYLRDCKLGHSPIAPTVILAPEGQVPNLSFLSHYTSHLSIITDEDLCQALEPLKSDQRLIAPIEHYVMPDHKAAEVYRVFSEWGERPPLIELLPEYHERGDQWLRQQGIPEDCWLALFHARSSGGRPQDIAHNHRNVDILSYIPAMELVKAQGGICIRMGDPMMEAFPSKAGVIDYAHHPDRRDWLDVYLCSKARFAIASTSGFASMCTVFHTPTAITNMVPASFLPVAPRDIGILKLLYSETENRYLSFPEVFNSELANLNAWTRRADEWFSQGLRFISNSPSDVLQLTLEMLQRTNGEFEDSDEDLARQGAFRSLWNEETDYAFYSEAKLGRDFLRTHDYLLK